MSWLENFRRFLADRGGNVAVIVAFVFLPVLIIAGAAVDLARYEWARTILQDGVDRAALAGAALTQTRPLGETVEQYMANVDFLAETQLTYSEQSFLTKRDVEVRAVYPLKTTFLNFVGIEKLDVVAYGAATQSRMNVEISLVLDVSISMWDLSGKSGNTRFQNLKLASADFLDALLTPETRSVTTISVVPFSGHVNMGRTMFNAMGAKRTHNDNSCIDFTTAEYSSSAMVNFNNRAQLPHFIGYTPDPRTNNPEGWVKGREPAKGWWCPGEETSISYFSNDATTLKNRINNFILYSATGINNAVKWGAMLLDPSAQPLVETAITAGITPAVARGRPVSYSDDETVKILVLMTDGGISRQMRPKSTYRYPDRMNDTTEVSSERTNATYLERACDAAKNNGIIIYTIGFEVASEYSGQMRNCATTPSHYYSVSGLDIRTAFQSIASAIQSLRLTQ